MQRIFTMLGLAMALFLVAIATGINNPTPAATNPQLEQRSAIAWEQWDAWDEEPQERPQERHGRPLERREYRDTITRQEPQERPQEQPQERQPRGRWVMAKVTAYTPWDAIDSNSGYQDGYTSTMVDTRSSNPANAYGIAADPRAIPYGTKIYVPGYWESLQNNKNTIPTEMTVVDDTGGMMRRNWRKGIIHVDVRYRTSKAARNWGVKWMKIFIYD